MDAQTPPSQGPNASAPIAAGVAPLLNAAQPSTLVPPSPPEALAAETKMPTTTNSQRTESAVSTNAVQSKASVSMPVASSRVTSVATRNQSRSESKPAQPKVDTPLAASSVSFPMLSPAVPTPASSSSSSSSSSSTSSSPSSSVQRRTKRHKTQSDIDDEADFDMTVEPLSQPQEDNSRLRCLWHQTQSLNERHSQHQHRHQQQELPETSRSKGKSRAMEISTIAETCRISFESDIELIGHYVRHISLMETRFECPVKLCKTILPTERHLQMHLERFHPEIKSKASLRAGTRKKPPSTDSPDTPKRGSSRSTTPASTSGRTAPQLQQTKQRRTRMQTKGSKTIQTAPSAANATKRMFKESTSAVSATKRVFRESSPAASAKKIRGSPSASLSATRDISESIATIDKALSLGAFFSPTKKSSGKMTATRARG
ncbi:hypothetical protein BGZ75_006824 [Mortierella antarctica]|nr:hypothetical protein BGZ75_006824 [Mortierella antarctica]